MRITRLPPLGHLLYLDWMWLSMGIPAESRKELTAHRCVIGANKQMDAFAAAIAPPYVGPLYCLLGSGVEDVELPS